MNDATQEIAARLEYLRTELRAGTMSYGELVELQSLARHIGPDDVELLEAAGVPEFPDDYAEEFTFGYAYAMLWANTTAVRAGEPTGEDVTPEQWQEPRAGWELRAFDDEAQDAITTECEDFVRANWVDLRALDARQAGADFALTRNHHGAGFWDRGLGEIGARLTEASHAYGDQSAYFDADDDSAVVHLG